MQFQQREISTHAYDIRFHDGGPNNQQSIIHSWSFDQDSKPHLLRVFDFPVFCRMQLPSFVMNGSVMTPMMWTPESLDSLFVRINQKLMNQRKDLPTNWVLQYQEKIYYYNAGRKFPMPLVFFKNQKAMRDFISVMKYPIYTSEWGSLNCHVWEDDIPPIRKWITACASKDSEGKIVDELTFCGWMKCNATLVPESLKVSTIEHEYFVSWTDVRPIPVAECESWATSPLVLSFDLENYSHMPLCLPKHDHPEDAVIMNSCIVQRQGSDNSTRMRYCFVLGNCPDIPETELPNTKIICVADEVDAILKFGDLVREVDPDIITGYNIQGWDYPALDARLTTIYGSKWPTMGRIRNEQTKLVSKTWQSSGYGFMRLNYLDMEGRISIDMLPYVQREPVKLRSYRLDKVAAHYLGRGKHPVTPQDIFEAFRLMRNTLTVLYAFNEAAKLDPSVLQDTSYQEAFNRTLELYKEALEKYKKVVRYCIEDSEVTIDLFFKLDVWFALIGLARVAGVTPLELVNNGQQRRCISLIYNKACARDIVIDKRQEPKLPYAGGHVGQPDPGVYDCIMFLDFASLYPSIIQAYNICYTTLVPPELFDKIPDDQVHIIKFQQEEEETGPEDDDDDLDYETIKRRRKAKKANAPTVTKDYCFKFVKSPEGILPTICRELVNERAYVRDVLLPAATGILKKVLNCRQMGLKITANSVYGFLGVEGGKLPLKEGAMCVTAKGRELILWVNEFLKKEYNASIVYNDTDSAAIQEPGLTDRKKVNARGHELVEIINAFLPPPLKLTYEKGGLMLIFCKKKYELMYITDKGELELGKDGKYKLLSRGDVMARRENCSFIKKWYHELLICVMERRPIVEAVTIIIKYTMELLEEKVPDEQLEGIRGLAPHYSSVNYPMNIFANRLRQAGKSAVPGDRIEFLFIKDPPIAPTDHVGWKMYTPDEVQEAKARGKPLKIDYAFYLQRVFKNHINQLFSVGYKEELKKLTKCVYRPIRGQKDRTLDTICDIFYFYERDGYRKLIPMMKDWIIEELKPKDCSFVIDGAPTEQTASSQYSNQYAGQYVGQYGAIPQQGGVDFTNVAHSNAWYPSSNYDAKFDLDNGASCQTSNQTSNQVPYNPYYNYGINDPSNISNGGMDAVFTF